MATTVDAKTAARQRVRAFLDARASYASDLGDPRFLDDQVASQSTIARRTFTLAPDGEGPLSEENPKPIKVVPLLASDLAILTAED